MRICKIVQYFWNQQDFDGTAILWLCFLCKFAETILIITNLSNKFSLLNALITVLYVFNK